MRRRQRRGGGGGGEEEKKKARSFRLFNKTVQVSHKYSKQYYCQHFPISIF
jgi:hypothetical protein